MSWRLADPQTVRWCRVSGDREVRVAQRQAWPSSSSSSHRCDRNTHRATHIGPPVTACLSENGPVYSLCASLPVSITSDQRRATVTRLNKTSVSHSAPPDWTPTVSTVHNEQVGVTFYPLWNAGRLKEEASREWQDAPLC